MSFYAVAKGRTSGVFHSWPECDEQVKGYTGAKYKKFKTLEEANNFVKEFGPKSPFQAAQLLFRDFKDSFLQSVHDSNLRRKLDNFERQFNLLNPSPVLASSTDSRQYGNAASAEPPLKRQRKAEFLETLPNDLKVDEDGYVHCYTDGACSNNGRSQSRGGYGVFWADGHSFNKSGRASRDTNNCGEIEAVTEALKTARENGFKKVKILTDSDFTIKCVTLWMSKWKKNNWKKSDGGEVKNRVELEALDGVMNYPVPLLVKFEHVPAHQGIHGNEMADQLAKDGAKL